MTFPCDFGFFPECLWEAWIFLKTWSVAPLLLLIINVLLLALNTIYRPKRNNLPGPWAMPIIGSKWIFWGRYRMNKLHEAYADMFKRYGDIFAETFMDRSIMVSIADRDGLETVLRTPSKRPYRPPTEIVQVYRRTRPDRYASTGLVNEQDEIWLHLRNHLTTDLTCPHTMQGFLPDLNIICQDFLKLLTMFRKPDGTVNAFDQLTNRMGLESVCALMLGSRLGFLDRWMYSRSANLAAAIKAHFRAQRDSYYGVPYWKYISTRNYRSLAKSEDTIYSIVSDLMEEAKLRSLGLERDGVREIFRNIHDDPNLDIREKKTAVIDFVTAGMETLSNTLVFLLYLLSKRPDWQRRIHDLLPAHAMYNNVDELVATPLIKASVNEAFRLLPTAPFLARLLEVPLVVRGVLVPRCTFLLCHTGIACRREENFWRAEEYCPERWLEVKQPHAPSLVAPFGRGRRMCPGKRFVESELYVLLTKILQKWRVEFDGELDIEFDFLMCPKTPVVLRLIDW